jgi:hypothetical protein
MWFQLETVRATKNQPLAIRSLQLAKSKAHFWPLISADER